MAISETARTNHQTLFPAAIREWRSAPGRCDRTRSAFTTIYLRFWGRWYEFGPRPSGSNLWSGAYFCSPNWTRTSNLPINSRLLCRLSYEGLCTARPY